MTDCASPTSIQLANEASISQGVKFIPLGLHLFVFSAAPSGSDGAAPQTDSTSSVGSRHGILKFYRGNECVAEEWDNKREELKSLGSKRPRRRRTTAGTDSTETLASPDYLKSLDSALAPYPHEEIAEHWPALTGCITEKTLARVVGIDTAGCAHVDALTATSDDTAVQAAAGRARKQVWGKPRPEAEDERPTYAPGEEEQDASAADDPEDLLQFARFDEKRSWPQGAVGEALTRWSQDKSWQLSQIVREQLDDGALLLRLIPFLARTDANVPCRRARTSRRAAALVHPLLAPAQLCRARRVPLSLCSHLPRLDPRPAASRAARVRRASVASLDDLRLAALRRLPANCSQPDRVPRAEFLRNAAAVA